MAEMSHQVFFCSLQLTVIHPQLPQEPAKVSSKVDIQLTAKDSHLKIGVHGVETPLYNLASSNRYIFTFHISNSNNDIFCKKQFNQKFITKFGIFHEKKNHHIQFWFI